VLNQTGLELSNATKTSDISMGMGSLYGDVEELSSQHIGGAIKAT